MRARRGAITFAIRGTMGHVGCIESRRWTARTAATSEPAESLWIAVRGQPAVRLAVAACTGA